MAYKEKEIEKIYFSIGEVSELLQINASQIRYWEGEFSVLKPRKDRKGNRLFVKEDIETIKLIQYLVKDKGYTLEGAKAKLKGGLDDVQQKFKVIKKKQKVKGFLEQLKEEL
mgnify:CR=1 FL=1